MSSITGKALEVVTVSAVLLAHIWCDSVQQLRHKLHTDLVLKGTECSIKPGEKIGIVGKTESGKSSLISALFRIIESVHGEILVDGQDTGAVLHTG